MRLKRLKRMRLTADGCLQPQSWVAALFREGEYRGLPVECQSAPDFFQFTAFGNSQRAAYNRSQHQHDWQSLMLIAGKLVRYFTPVVQ